MRKLSPEEMQDARDEIAAVAISDARKDELIRFIDAIAVLFTQQAFYRGSVQLSPSARANFAFIGGEAHARACFELTDSAGIHKAEAM